MERLSGMVNKQEAVMDSLEVLTKHGL